MKYLQFLIFSSLLLVSSTSFALLNGQLDMTFNPQDGGNWAGYGAASNLQSVAVRPDGKVLIGGGSYYYNGKGYGGPNDYVFGMARLNADGTYDEGYHPGSISYLLNGYVLDMEIQPDGKIIVGGGFKGNCNCSNDINRIVRLSENGGRDASFNVGKGANNTVNEVELQADGKVFIAGAFTSYNNIAINKIARLNSDGTLDTSFNPGVGFNGDVYAMEVDANGKVIVGGDFTSYQGQSVNHIVRLNEGGSIDNSFNIGSGMDGAVNEIRIQDDGKVIAVGGFTSYRGNNAYGVVRINTNGSFDGSFNVGVVTGGSVYSVAIQGDAKILLGGDFLDFNGVTDNRIVRVNNNGTLDNTFDPIPYTAIGSWGLGGGSVNDIQVLPDNKILLVGAFRKLDDIPGLADGVMRLFPDGKIDSSFNPTKSANSQIYAIERQDDGKFIIGGEFTIYDGKVTPRLARVFPDGSIDPSFDVGNGTNNLVYDIAMLPDGKILIGGKFTEYNGTPVNMLARINSDGDFDGTFSAGIQSGIEVNKIYPMANGKILVAGHISVYGGQSVKNIIRLNSDGSLDTTFLSINDTNYRIKDFALQSDGKIVLGRMRLNADGSLDSAYGSSSYFYVTAVAVLPDDKVVVADTSSDIVYRLNSNGTNDNSFTNFTFYTSNASLLSIGNGEILFGDSGNVVWLDNQGHQKQGFYSTGNQFGGSIHELLMLENQQIMLVGTFITYDGAGRNFIAKLSNGDSDDDGEPDVTDAFPNDPTETLDTDGDLIGNNADWDDDDDGVPDVVDAEPLNNANINEISLPLDGSYKGFQLQQQGAQ